MKNVTKAGTKRHRVLRGLIVAFVLLIGLSLLLYPTVADYINSLNNINDIELYRESIRRMDYDARKNMLEAARLWNAELLGGSTKMGEPDEESAERYASLLDPTGTGMMGYLRIEKISLYLPIYHGTDESVLHSGIGHFAGSSLPVGGEGTHSLLSGHSGLPSARLFSNIDQLEPGDTFEIHVLDEVLTYQVESVEVVLPEDAEIQEINPERDVCTLMTCTPYGVNTHRLLVRGVRIESTRSDAEREVGVFEAIFAPMPKILWAVVIGMMVALLAAVFFFLGRRKMKRKIEGGRHETGKDDKNE